MPADNGLPFLLSATLSIALLIGCAPKCAASRWVMWRHLQLMALLVQIESGFDEASPGRQS